MEPKEYKKQPEISMGEKAYSKRELDHYFQDMKSDIKEILIDGKETKVQVYKTNGRVTRLEWQTRVFWWALGAIWTLIVMMAPSIIRFVQQINRVNATVSELTKEYDVK